MIRAPRRRARRLRVTLAGVLLGAVTASVLDAGPASAQAPEDFLRPCRRADLLGLWRVLRFGIAAGAEVDRTDPAYQPHQRYVFHRNATMAYVASATTLSPGEQQALVAAPAQTTWALDERGRLRRQANGATRAETSECMVLTRPVQDSRSSVTTQPGDILLTDLGPDERPAARRLLRKLSESE